MRIGVYPGSFDPVTYGHLDIVLRASRLFDRLYVAVLLNPDKDPFFSVEQRVAMLQEVTADYGNVRCESFTGLAAEYAEKRQAHALVRGLRAVSDFEVEFKMAAMNRHLNPKIETVFLVPSSEHTFISSSIIREVAALGGDVSEFVPAVVLQQLQARFQRTEGKEQQ